MESPASTSGRRAQARAASQGEALAAIRKATDDLQRASHALAEQLYKGSQGSHFSEFTFDDTKGSELIFFHAENEGESPIYAIDSTAGSTPRTIVRDMPTSTKLLLGPYRNWRV